MKNRDLEELKNEVELCERILGDALVDADQSTITKASKSLDVARQALTYAELAVKAVQHREAASEQQREADAVARQWGQVGTLSDERDELVADLVKHVAAMASPFARVVEINNQILALLPIRIDTDRAELRHPHTMVIEEFWRGNLVSGSPWSSWELDRRARMADRIKAAGQYLKSFSN